MSATDVQSNKTIVCLQADIEQTTVSINLISDSTREVLARSRDAVGGMEAIVSKVRGGKDLSVQAADRMNTIQQNKEQVTHAIDDISSVLSEQSSSAQEIARRVELVAQISEENCRVSQVAAELRGHAENLRAAVNQFCIYRSRFGVPIFSG